MEGDLDCESVDELDLLAFLDLFGDLDDRGDLDDPLGEQEYFFIEVDLFGDLDFLCEVEHRGDIDLRGDLETFGDIEWDDELDVDGFKPLECSNRFKDLSSSGDIDFGDLDLVEDLDLSEGLYFDSLEAEPGLDLFFEEGLLLESVKSMVSTVSIEFCFTGNDLLHFALEGSCDFLHLGE